MLIIALKIIWKGQITKIFKLLKKNKITQKIKIIIIIAIIITPLLIRKKWLSLKILLEKIKMNFY